MYLASEADSCIIQINLTKDNKHTHKSTAKLTGFTCLATVSEDQAHQDFITADPTRHHYTTKRTSHRHDSCYEPTVERPKMASRHINLCLLRACRQIYHEAKWSLYSTNTFSFECPTVMEKFIGTMSTKSGLKQHLAIRNLHLDITVFHPYNEESWAAGIKQVLKKVKGLQRVYIDLNQIFCICWIYRCGYKFVTENIPPESIQEMRKLPLKDAKIIIEDEDLLAGSVSYPEEEVNDHPSRWTLAQKQEWVKGTRNLLLTKFRPNSPQPLQPQALPSTLSE